VSDNISVAFAGPADVTPEAIEALLNDYLGFGPDDADGFPLPSDREIELIFPIREDHLSSGLMNVIEWSGDVDLPFTAVTDKADRSKVVANIVEDAAEVIEATNVNAKIIDMLAHAEGEGVLVLLWGEGDDAGDEDTEMLLDLALAENVKVVDLTAGLDDMTFADETPEPEPEPEIVPRGRGRRSAAKAEPEPEPVKPARRGSRRAAAEPEPESTVVEEHVPVDPTAKPARRGRSRKAEEPLVQPEEPLVDEPVTEEPAKPARRSRKAAKPEMTTEEATKDYHDRLNAAKEKAGLSEAREAAVKEAGEEAVQQVEQEIVSNGVLAGRPPVFASLELIKGTLSAVYLYLDTQTELMSLGMLTPVGESPLAEAVREALEALEAGITFPAAEEAPKRGRGRPRKEPDANDTTAYFEDGDGIIRVATRGRPRRGETRVELTALEVQVKTEDGLLED